MTIRSVGVTGGIGSGKSAVVGILAGLGATVIDADRVGHETYQPGTIGFTRVVEAFGDAVVGAGGAIDRKRLGAMVFADATALARLNAIVHPLIRDLVGTRLQAALAAGSGPLVVEAALLIEAGWDALVDEVWVVTARRDVIEARLVSGRGMDPAEIAARMRAQLDDAARTERADVVLDNSGSPDALRAEVERLWRERLAG